MIRTTQAFLQGSDCLCYNHFSCMFLCRVLLISDCSFHFAPTRLLPHHLRSASLRSITTSTRFLQNAKVLNTVSGLITPESRLRDLQGRGFYEYPRSDGKSISEIRAFRERWSGKISAGETDVSEGLTTGMTDAKSWKLCI